MAQPWFKFYPANFVEATYTWKPYVVGIYWRLLIYQYAHGAIPKDTEEILEIANCTIEEWNSAWKKLSKKFQVSEDGQGYLNPRMDLSRQESTNSYERRVQAAKKSHESRKKNKLQSNCNASCNGLARTSGSGSGSNSGSKSSSASDSKEVHQVLEHWKKWHPKSKPGDKQRRTIKARLKEKWSVEELSLAIDGIHKSSWHIKENQISLVLALRDSDQVAKFIRLMEYPGAFADDPIERSRMVQL